jgi:hypothetical protein
MRKKHAYLLVIPMAILVFLLVTGIFIFGGKPKVTVNYIAEYNKISRPDGFDPNDNADEFYKEAGKAYVSPSMLAKYAANKEFQDINDDDMASLKEWIGKNSRCLKYLEEGNKKKFFWAKEDENRDGILSIKNLGPESMYLIVHLLEQKARVAAMDGNFEDSLKSLLEWWKISRHYSNPKMLWPQEEIRTKSQILKVASLILDYFAMDANNLRLWQEKWQKEFVADDYIPNFQTQRLYYYDQIQRNFVYNTKGEGRLAWKRAKDFVCACGEEYNRRIYLSCFNGPTSNEVSQIVSSVCDYYQGIVNKTPWEVRYPEREFKDHLEEIKKKQPIFDHFIPIVRGTWIHYHGLNAQKDAFVTAIAVLRYKADHSTYPENLEVLLKDKYIEKLPKDPFSDRPLVYRLLNDEFELYSVGLDFEDNGGKGVMGRDFPAMNDKGDDIFWPPLKRDLQQRKLYRFKSELQDGQAIQRP